MNSSSPVYRGAASEIVVLLAVRGVKRVDFSKLVISVQAATVGVSNDSIHKKME